MGRIRTFLPTWAFVALVAAVLLFEVMSEKRSGSLSRVEGGVAVRLAKVIDGDTVDVFDSTGSRIRVRLLGIDCMETFNEEKMHRQARRLQIRVSEVQHLGQQAKDRLRGLVKDGELILIQPEGYPVEDSYGRTLAYLQVGGEDVAESLLKEGLAETRREPHPRAVAYQSLSRRAKQNRLGIHQD